MTKYSVPSDHWDRDEPDGPPRWVEETSCDIEIDVQLHQQGYQEDRKWTVHCTHRPDDDMAEMTAMYAVEHRNKGNYWRDGDLYDDAIDFVDLPLRCRQHVAAVLNRDLATITPDDRLLHREDGTGVGDRSTEGEDAE